MLPYRLDDRVLAVSLGQGHTPDLKELTHLNQTLFVDLETKLISKLTRTTAFGELVYVYANHQAQNGVMQTTSFQIVCSILAKTVVVACLLIPPMALSALVGIQD
jgi:phage-related baseplate assembly protein